MQVEVSRNGPRDGRLTCPATRGEIPCGYCFSRWATGYDHLIPWVYGGTGEESNLYPCCRRCNSILGSRIFDSLQEKRKYVRNWLIERGEWYDYDDSVSILPESIPAEPSPKILYPEVPMERLDFKKSCVRIGEAWRAETPRRWQPGITRRCRSCRIVFECPKNPRQICEPLCEQRQSIRHRWEYIREQMRQHRRMTGNRQGDALLKKQCAEYIERWLALTNLPIVDDDAVIHGFTDSVSDKCDVCERRIYLHPRFAFRPNLLIVGRVCSGNYYDAASGRK